MRIAITTSIDNHFLVSQALTFAQELEIDYVERKKYTVKDLFRVYDYDHFLIIESSKIVLAEEAQTFFWHPNTAIIRLAELKNSKRSYLLDALNLEETDTVLDCTLGLASDALVIASRLEKGQVIGLESSKFISFITRNGLRNFQMNKELTEYAKRIDVINTEYYNYLKLQPDNSVDVVYIDPMFKEPIKESDSINSFRNYANHELLSLEALEEAKRVAKKRVVVKERLGYGEFQRLGIDKKVGRLFKRGKIVYGIIELKN